MEDVLEILTETRRSAQASYELALQERDANRERALQSERMLDNAIARLDASASIPAGTARRLERCRPQMTLVDLLAGIAVGPMQHAAPTGDPQIDVRVATQELRRTRDRLAGEAASWQLWDKRLRADAMDLALEPA